MNIDVWIITCGNNSNKLIEKTLDAALLALRVFLDEANYREPYQIEKQMMTEEEFASLPEFDGF